MVRVLAIVLALCATAHADPLDEARQLEAKLDYAGALAIVDAAIASGHANDLAKLHFEAGKLAAGLDRSIDAEQHFAIALELDASLALPEGSSPKLTAPYYAARARVQAQHPSPATSDHVSNAVATRATLPAPHVGWYANWRVWTAVGVFAAGTGALCAWRESVAQSDWTALNATAAPEYSQLRAIENRGNDWALATNIGFGIAAAAVVAGAISFVHEQRLYVAATPRSLGVAVRF